MAAGHPLPLRELLRRSSGAISCLCWRWAVGGQVLRKRRARGAEVCPLPGSLARKGFLGATPADKDVAQAGGGVCGGKY